MALRESVYEIVLLSKGKYEYEDYDRTNQFYISLGFKEFEVLNSLWDENNPCQIYVMAV